MSLIVNLCQDSSENRKSDAYRGGSRSPPYDERNSRSSYEERRSPGYYGTSPGRLDSTDERHGNDFHNRTSEDRRLPDGLPRSEARTAGLQKDSKTPSPPMIRPLREILGEDPPPLRVGGDHSQTDATKTANGALGTQVGFCISILIYMVFGFLFCLHTNFPISEGHIVK